MSTTIFERIENNQKKILKINEKKIEKKLWNKVVCMRLEELFRGKPFLEKIRLLLKIW